MTKFWNFINLPTLLTWLNTVKLLFRERPSVVRLGDLDLSTSDEDSAPQDVKIKNVYVFDGYKPPAKYHDIAIVELAGNVNRSQFTDIACLDSSRYHNESSYLVMGWGKTEFAGKHHWDCDREVKNLKNSLNMFSF